MKKYNQPEPDKIKFLITALTYFGAFFIFSQTAHAGLDVKSAPTTIKVTTGIGTDLVPTLDSISAAQPFATMRGSIQLLGLSPSPLLSSVSEATGITYTGEINGSTLRFGKVTDPLNPSRQVLYFAGKSSDPDTKTHKRAEIQMSQSTVSIKVGTTYWIACELYVPAVRLVNGGSGNLMQVHTSASGATIFGPLALVASPGKVTVVYRYSDSGSGTENGGKLWEDFKYPTDTWQKWIFKFKTHYQGANGAFLQAWQNGVQRVNYTGPIGLNTPGNYDYVKFGWDDWSGQGGGTAGAYNMARSCHVVQDAGYTLNQINELLR